VSRISSRSDIAGHAVPSGFCTTDNGVSDPNMWSLSLVECAIPRVLKVTGLFLLRRYNHPPPPPSQARSKLTAYCWGHHQPLPPICREPRKDHRGPPRPGRRDVAVVSATHQLCMEVPKLSNLFKRERLNTNREGSRATPHVV
jgi:hypothetical protein